MIIRDLIKELLDYNPDAKINVVINSKPYFDLSFGYGALDGEGMNKKKTTSVSIIIDDLNTNDNTIEQTEH